jgi:hypothetical protein
MENPAKRRLYILVIILLLFSNLTTIAFMVYQHFKPPLSGNNPVEKVCYMKSALNLTTDQEIKYKQIKSDFQKKADPVAENLGMQQEKIMQELSQSEPKMNIIDSLQKISMTLQHELFNQSVSQFLTIRRILNKDQSDELAKVYRQLFGCSMKNCEMKGNQKQN